MKLTAALSRVFAKASANWQYSLDEKLIAAAVPGDPVQVWATMSRLIERGANINAWDKDSQGPLLCRVCVCGLDGIAEKMLAAGAAVDARSSNGSTPFLLAAGAGEFKIMTSLADKGADLRAERSDGRNALYLLLQGLETRPTAKQNFGAAYDILRKRAGLMLNDAQRRYIFSGRPEFAFLDPVLDGEYKLHQAADAGDVAAVRRLLAEGIKADSAGKYGENRALYGAICRGNAEMVEVLLQAGASLQRGFAKDSSKPIELAVKQGNLEVVKILLNHGADPTKPMILRHLNGGTTEIPLADSALTHRHPEMAAFIEDTVKNWTGPRPNISTRKDIGIISPIKLLKPEERPASVPFSLKIVRPNAPR